MNTPCAACTSGPSGIDGHADLRALTIGREALSFKCGRCEALWSRSGPGASAFAWALLSDRETASPRNGVLLPPRKPQSA